MDDTRDRRDELPKLTLHFKTPAERQQFVSAMVLAIKSEKNQRHGLFRAVWKWGVE